MKRKLKLKTGVKRSCVWVWADHTGFLKAVTFEDVPNCWSGEACARLFIYERPIDRRTGATMFGTWPKAIVLPEGKKPYRLEAK